MKPEDVIRIKELLPTALGSDEIREQIAADILRRSVFSARMTSASYLAKIREVCMKMSAGKINAADARMQLLKILEQMGHSPADEGGLKNPASIRRINLIVDTQTQMASSVARIANQNEATLALFPAWELRRMGSRSVPREDWDARWRAAGESIGWQGAHRRYFIALKNSPIWAALGNGTGGFRDTLGNPYPPFAYGSGMDWINVSAETCDKIGLQHDDAAPGKTPTLSPGERDIADAIARYGFQDIEEDLI